MADAARLKELADRLEQAEPTVVTGEWVADNFVLGARDGRERVAAQKAQMAHDAFWIAEHLLHEAIKLSEEAS